MIVIVCLDERGGMMFNNRRQSRDKAVIDRIVEIVQGSKLWLSSYSKSLFDQVAILLEVDDNFLQKAGNGEFCFVENADITQYTPKIEKLYIFRWNRHYPADFYFTLDLAEYRMITQSEFMGNSHEKITLEVYER